MELKSCPFCGGEAELNRKQLADMSVEAVWVECKDCGAKSAFYSIRKNRIPPRAKSSDDCFSTIRDAWNRRTE